MGALVRLPGSLPQSHGIPTEVAFEEGWIEAQAIAGEAERFAASVAAVARLVQVAIAAGRPSLAGTYADQLERAAAKATHRAKVARIAASIADGTCPGEEASHLSGGRAA